jgi:alpha-tubulin suppressor-like RCC1 family protein
VNSLALKGDGSIVGWGNNGYGQATPPGGNDYIAIAAGGYHSVALKSDGSLVCWGDNSSGQCDYPAGNDFVAIEAGYSHTLALKSDGTIVEWGVLVQERGFKKLSAEWVNQDSPSGQVIA